MCYHRFEAQPKDGLAISPEAFEAQLQALKDQGISVISMRDFLAWRSGEKSIPARSVLLTIDDGYLSGYSVAWPILKKFGYPFTMYIYTDYVKGGPRSGGQSMTWEQLREMRDAGVDIGNHSISHASLSSRKSRSEEAYLAWVREELVTSKKMLEDNLGVPIRTYAYPYGNQNETVRQIAQEAGYEAAFTVRGQKLGAGGDAMQLGRYAIDSNKPEIFAMATRFQTTGTLAASQLGGSPTAAGSDAAAPGSGHPISLVPGSTLTGPLPTISVNLGGLAPLDEKSLVMTVSGLGQVPAEFDPGTATLSYTPAARLYAPEVVVTVTGRAGGKKFEERWSYTTSLAIPSRAATMPET